MRVGIVSYGMTKFSQRDQDIELVILESIRDLLESNSSIDRREIDAVLVSTNSNEKYLAAVSSEMIGIAPKISHTVESLCNSGTNAISTGYSYIAAGLADLVLVCGAERYDSPGQVLTWDKARGEFMHPIFWASLFTQAYTSKYQIKPEQLALVAVKNNHQAKYNPYAFDPRSLDVDDVLGSRQLTQDLRLYECSRPCTGSATILLAAESIAHKISDDITWITGIGQKTISGGFTKNESLTCIESTRIAGQSALAMAGHTIDKVDVAEIHDAFAVCEPMILESLGFATAGHGVSLVDELYSTQDFKINPRGGLLGSGHPLGATGIAQTIEIATQLGSKAGKRQIDAEIGLVQNMAAAATSSTVLVLER